MTRHHAFIDNHRVELDFDQKLVVLNRARLMLDGQEVDSARVVYGERELSTTLEDGTEIEIRLHSGMVGELTRAQIRTGSGDWADLTDD